MFVISIQLIDILFELSTNSTKALLRETNKSYQPVQQTWVIQLNNSTIGFFQPVQLKHRFQPILRIKGNYVGF